MTIDTPELGAAGTAAEVGTLSARLKSLRWIAISCEPAGEEPDAGDESPGAGAFDCFLPVLGKASAPAEPGECAFDDPSARQHLKSSGRVGSLDDLDGPVPMPVEGIAQFAARIAAIGEDVAQPWKAVADGLEQRRCSVSILSIGRMNKDDEHQPECVGDDGALAAVDLFPGVVARYASAFGRLHALAVDDARRGTGLAAFQFTRAHDQQLVEGLPQTAVTPSVEVALHRGPRRKILGEHPPLAPAGRDEQNGIHDRAQIDRARPSSRPGRWPQRRNDRPFPIRHVARIARAHTPMILASDVIPGHSILRLLNQTRRSTTC